MKSTARQEGPPEHDAPRLRAQEAAELPEPEELSARGDDADERPTRVPPPTRAAVGADTPGPQRRYAVCQQWLLIGTTDLEVTVENGARAAGRFHPTESWLALEPVFAMYQRSVLRNDRGLLREYVRQRDALGLRVWRGGEEVDAVVELISTWRRGTHIIHVASRDPRFWRWRFPD